MDLLQLFNGIAVIANPNLKGKNLPENLNQSLADTDVDSLDRVMISVYICDIYGIMEEIGKRMPLESAQRMFDFALHHKTKEPESLESALESIK